MNTARNFFGLFIAFMLRIILIPRSERWLPKKKNLIDSIFLKMMPVGLYNALVLCVIMRETQKKEPRSFAQSHL